MMNHILFLVLTLILSGCASKSKVMEEPVASKSSRFWRLTFDKRLELNDFAAPILNLDFGNETLPFLVNTASTFHSIDTWAAEVLNFKSNQNVIQTSFKIYSYPFAKANFHIKKMNSRYEENGVAGLVSPQLLMENDAIALDFLNSKVYRGKYDELINKYNVVEQIGNACTNQGQEKASLYIVPVKINESVLNLLVDSSAEDTTIKASLPFSKSLNQKLNGKIIKLHKIQLSIAGKKVTRLIDIKKLPELPCKADGLLGMDVLKLCILVLNKDKYALDCQSH